MKRTPDAKGSITKPLLTGLTDAKPSKTTEKVDSKTPSFGKSSTIQADLNQDPGGGYNVDLSFVQD